jgi:hypothetical protein
MYRNISLAPSTVQNVVILAVFCPCSALGGVRHLFPAISAHREPTSEEPCDGDEPRIPIHHHHHRLHAYFRTSLCRLQPRYVNYHQQINYSSSVRNSATHWKRQAHRHAFQDNVTFPPLPTHQNVSVLAPRDSRQAQ